MSNLDEKLLNAHCSQKTSCEEAEFFLANCPGVGWTGAATGCPARGSGATIGRVGEGCHRSATERLGDVGETQVLNRGCSLT